MLLSIVIINYNTFELTCNCIRSIEATASCEYEIILIDNNSKERNPDDFLQVFPRIRLIALPENVGFGRANNVGMNAAGGEFLLLLNSDTVVHDRTIDEPLAYLQAHREIDILGPLSRFPGGEAQLTTFDYRGELKLFTAATIFFKANAVVSRLVQFLKYRKAPSPAGEQVPRPAPEGGEQGMTLTPNYSNGHEIGSLVGVYLLFRKVLFTETGGFDPDFFMYFEETEWFVHRLKRYTKLYYPFVSLTHFAGKSDVYGKMKLQFTVSQYLYWYKLSYGHYALYLLFSFVQIPSLLLAALFTFNRSYIAECRLQCKALPYALFAIPRYSNRFGARPQMLKLRSLRKKNL